MSTSSSSQDPRTRRHGSLRVLLAAAVAVCLLAFGGEAVTQARSRPALVSSQPQHQLARPARVRTATAVAPQQQVAILFSSHTALVAPRFGSRRVMTVAPRRPITGERTTLPVLAQRTDSRGVSWLEVRLPGRPNSHTGWITARGTGASFVFWHLLVNLRARTVTAYLDGQPQRTFRAVVGKPSTPTPTGEFFVEESLRMPANDPGGPYALALSARSTVYRSFDGGPGQVAVHGRDGLGGTLGAAQSHGCVRLSSAAITWLVQRFGPGTPVTIRAR